MSVTVSDLLKLPIFQNARLLFGKEGVSRSISRISVFDCPVEPDDAEIIHAGDAFISGLLQFNSDGRAVVDFIRFLYRLESSCLFITDENIHALDEGVSDQLALIPYPVICLPKQISYAVILETVNNQLLFHNFHMVTELTLDKILYSNTGGRELSECIYGLNSGFKSYVAALSIDCGGQDKRAFMAGFSHLLRRSDFLTPYKRHYILLISDSERRLLTRRIAFLKGKLTGLYPDMNCGISPAYALSDIKNAVREADFLLEKSTALQTLFCEACSFDAFDVLLACRRDKNLLNYYRRIYDVISTYDRDGHLELLRTIQEFVFCKGNFKRTAGSLQQHENTIRYRMNKVRTLLSMENDEIAFHETISLFVKLHLLLKEDR